MALVAAALTTAGASACYDSGPVIVSVSAGGDHACALDATGGVWCWGYNAAGQLGLGTTTTSTVPAMVEGLTGVLSVHAGHSHTCALKKDGTVWCWGRNTEGELGIGTNPGPESCPEIADPDDGCSTTPVQVLNLEGVVSISTGQLHACALKPDRTVWCWGDNQVGQLGDGTRTTRHFAVRVQGLTDATAVSAGLFHSCALEGEGTVWCWGDNSCGELGDGTTGESYTPVRVQGLPEAVSVAAGEDHTCALTAGGQAWCWGSNNRGLLGIGTEEGPEQCGSHDCSTVPVEVPGLTNVVGISLSMWSNACVLTRAGEVWCWGENYHGQLGIGTDEGPDTCGDFDRPCSKAPLRVHGLSAPRSVSAGGNFACAATAVGQVWCWGSGGSQLGIGIEEGPDTCGDYVEVSCSKVPVRAQF